MTVTALLVSHDGARWLPAVLAGLDNQRHRPAQVLAVDTGSSDESLDLVNAALDPACVSVHEGSFPEAVAHALPRITTEWVWLLHDDTNPDPGALAALLEAAENHHADIVGPKLREWPSLRRLLELGVTISGAGRRETGLERGEYDQGQHDSIREVLAVNTAGMLVRRSLLEELGGFDEALPVFGNDIDFGWRATRAGHKAIVAPEAVVFHAEAAIRGLRRTALTGRRTHREERRSALHTLLVNAAPRLVFLQAIRLLLGTFLRSFGYLLARSPGMVRDEFSALISVYAHPGRIRAGRRARQGLGDPRGERLKRLLAPWWLPYRHGIDFVSDVSTAVVNEGRDSAERRRAARIAESGPSGPGPDAEEGDELAPDSSLLARFVTSPTALLTTLFLLLSLWGAREAFHSITGGALSPSPDGSGDWWRLATEGWHQIGQGTDAPAPAYLLPMALMASILLGSASAAMSLLFIAAVPVAAWGAWRFGLVAAELGSGRPASRWIVAWAAMAYAAVPVASGAWGQGRFGVLASAALLPWLAHAALGLADPNPDRRWRAAWRSSLLLAMLTAFTPAAWLFAVLLVLLAVGALLVLSRAVLHDRSVWGPLLVVSLAPPLLLLPGAVGMLGHDVSALFLEAGRVMPMPGPLDIAAGRFDGPAAPHWIGLALVLPAVMAIFRTRSRLAVVGCWVVVTLAALLVAVLSHVEIELPAGSTRPGLGFLLVVSQAALIVAVMIAGHGLREGFVGANFGWRQPVAGVLAVVALIVPLGGLSWWWWGGGENLLQRPDESEVPAYMVQAASEGAGHGVLMLRGDVEDGLRWRVHRGEGVTVGQDEVLALTGPDAGLDADVAALVSDPTPDLVDSLPSRGIDYVVMPAPADAQVSATLDAATGLTQASTSDRSTRAWQFDTGASADAIDGDGPWWHPWLLILQIAAFLVVAVLCGPSRRERR
ncbi:glycosyltransferase family 2 protein [Nocardioides sp. JQ2195]|uniref:glycosyltransferase family 2 protein n=1 Tax=Nocardioides sp. JQ2195 TaxID=2592334 RepID=UPI00143E6009|nr:glycosyltransferase [Nocardioides sp. JQ2195]QIX25943.1 glycosyltransferase family 2 protein [Nocardioides sp. JQ2195]